MGCQLLLMTAPTPSVSEMWSRDGFDPGTEMESDDDEVVLNAFKKSIQYDGSRYVVSLP